MKRYSAIAVLCLLLALAAGCSAGAQELALGNAPWQDGDRALYDVLDASGNKLGTSEFTFARDGEAWLLSATDRIGEVEQTSQVRISAQTLKPLGLEKTIHTADTDVSLSAAYAAGKLDIQATVNGEDRSAAVNVPETALDNDQLLMTLRALAFAEDLRGRCVTVVPASASKVNTTISVEGREAVQGSAGSVDTWKVQLDFGQAKQYAWYQVGAPHNLVQYDNGSTRLVLTEE